MRGKVSALAILMITCERILASRCCLRLKREGLPSRWGVIKLTKAPDFIEQAASPIPMKKLSEPKDIANAFCFLVSRSMITRQVLVVDGGGAAVGM